jgi:DNA-binding MarR family transcriptional regulator
LANEGQEKDLIESTLQLSERAFRELFPILPKEWLALDLSTPQLKVVLLLLINGPCRMSVIAGALGVSLATATGVVDRLVDRGLVVREGDPEDRRVVLCRLSNKGEKMLVGLWQLARKHAEMMFRSLSPEKLVAVREGLEALLEAGAATKDQLGITNEFRTNRVVGKPRQRRKASGSTKKVKKQS